MVDFKKILPRKDSEEYFWSILIEPGWVQAGIWKVEGKEAKVFFISPATPWNLDEDLITSSDTVLSAVIQNFPEDVKEPSKTVFGVCSSWVEDGQIKSDYLEKIKTLCSELSLSPIGFVVLPEAIAHYRKSIDSVPLSAVTLGIYKDELEVSIFQNGKLLGVSQVARSVSLEDDVFEGLSRFSSLQNIPSLFLIYNGKEKELEDASQSLLKVNWEDFDKIKILHTPKIEVVSVKSKIYAVCLAGASEMAGATTLKIEESFWEDKVEGKVGVASFINKLDTSQVDSEKEEVDEFGKIDETTFSEAKRKVSQEKGQEEVDDSSPEDLGFVVDRNDDQEQTSKNIPTEDEIEGEEVLDENYNNVLPVGEGLVDKTLPDRKIGKMLSQLKDKLGFKKFQINFFRRLPFTLGRKVFTFGILFMFLLFALLFSVWWFLPKAKVTIYLSPMKLSETTQVSIDSSGRILENLEDKLPGEILRVSIAGEKTKDTTGVKLVGEKAKGEIVLYRVGSEVELKSGTQIEGPDNLKFTLDTNVAIASGSASSPSTARAKVTAKDIGAQYNLAGGTSFTVGDYLISEIEAKNEASFSGGTSYEVSAVSQEDIKNLEEELLEELSEGVKKKILGDVPDDKYFIESSSKIGIKEKNFSAKEGDEAETLKLSMEVEAKALVIKKEVLDDYALSFLREKVPQGYVLRKEQISYDFDFDKEEKGIYMFKLGILANLLPQLDGRIIAEKLRGKYRSVAEDYLSKDVAGFVKADIRIIPNFPDKIETLPHLVKNIEVEFAAEK